MMAVDVKQLNEAEKIDLTRCYAAMDKVIERRRIEAKSILSPV